MEDTAATGNSNHVLKIACCVFHLGSASSVHEYTLTHTQIMLNGPSISEPHPVHLDVRLGLTAPYDTLAYWLAASLP